jgi:NADH-quinone oxidoreductase subunit M
MNNFPAITLLTLLPVVAGMLLLFLRPAGEQARKLALGAGALLLLGTLGLWFAFPHGDSGMAFQERHDWAAALGIQYFVAVDGISILLVVLTGLLIPMSLLAGKPPEDRPALYYALVLFLGGGLIGTFTALNFFHWFIFWELSLIPAFFLIKLWGGTGRDGAATQFFIYTMVGSIAMLLAFLALFLATGQFDFLALAELGQKGALEGALAGAVGWSGISGSKLALLVFFGVFLGFAVKVPCMPFHTWLPSTYATAPTPVTMLLTGAMSKMGVYGLVRILLPIFPDQLRAVMPLLLVLAVATIVLAAWSAFAQTDLKRMFAYSSVNHLGYCLLGVFLVVQRQPGIGDNAISQAALLNGVVLQMFNHGLTAATLFCLLGMLEQRADGHESMGDFGGLRTVVPVYAGFVGIATFASLGLPGLNGFVGEFLIFRGAFGLNPWVAVVATPGLLITAIFLLTFFQRVFLGRLDERWQAMPDLTTKERWLIAPALLLMLVLGVAPQLVLSTINPAVQHLIAAVTP